MGIRTFSLPGSVNPKQLTSLVLHICALLVIGFGLSGCVNHGRIDYDNQHQKNLQAGAMERWNNCFDKHLDSHFKALKDANQAIDSTLQVCQGHRYDVVATYPRRLERGLDKKLVEIAYQQGLEKLAPLEKGTVLQRALALP